MLKRFEKLTEEMMHNFSVCSHLHCRILQAVCRILRRQAHSDLLDHFSFYLVAFYLKTSDKLGSMRNHHGYELKSILGKT